MITILMSKSAIAGLRRWLFYIFQALSTGSFLFCWTCSAGATSFWVWAAVSKDVITSSAVLVMATMAAVAAASMMFVTPCGPWVLKMLFLTLARSLLMMLLLLVMIAASSSSFLSWVWAGPATASLAATSCSRSVFRATVSSGRLGS